jgi:AraC-like DNA-binding protein
MSIQHYREINESHAATGYSGRTDLPAFHIFTVEETYGSTHQVMLPYTFDFYQVVLLENSPDAALSMNTEPLHDLIHDLSDTLTFASPAHVLAWMRGAAQRGFILYFKAEFLAQNCPDIQSEFPFFRLTELNWLRVAEADKARIRTHFTTLLATFQRAHPYRVPMLQAALLLLLYECKGLFAQAQQAQTYLSSQALLATRYQHFINQHFLTRKRVDAYADLLGISPDYLGQVVRQVTGRSASSLIVERILLEAKKLLRYSSLSVAEVADYLGFVEPTHFGRFFRRHTGASPHQWRQQP